MNTKQLRQQILLLAIQGKLVPQIAKEGSAKDLLKQIEAEKVKLIKEGKPQKSKHLPEITNEEKPFEIPDSWKWVRIEHISNSIFYGVSESAKVSGDYKLLRITDIQNNRVNWNNVPFTNYDKTKVSSYLLKKGDILFARTGGTVGKSYLVDECPSNSIFASYLIRVQPSSLCNSQYIKRFFESPWYWEQIIDKANGSGQPNCNGTKLANLLIPLPPLSEQKRIVAKLEDVLGEIDKIEKAQTRMTKGAKQLQNLILQTAIQGKLVQQIAKEGTAKDLLKQIENEKAKLIKEGKLKKSKPLPEITDEEKLFEIPDSWEWVRIGDIFMHATGKQLSGKNQKGSPQKYITTSNLYWGRFVLDNLKEMNYTDEELEKCSAQKGDLLVCEGGDIGRSAIWNYNYNICLQNHVHKLRYYIEGYTEYVYYVIRYYKNINEFDGKGIGIQGLSANVLKNICIPLPPLSEQKRIVAKLEKVLEKVEKLQN